MRLLFRALGTLLLILCGVLAGFLGYRQLHHPTLLVAAPPPGPGAPAPLPTPPAAATPDSGGQSPSTAAATSTAATIDTAATIPGTLPDIRIPDLNGRVRSLQEFRGHPLVVNFWATWCAPCRREMPLLQQLWQQHRAAGVQVVGIAVDSRSAVQQYLHKTPVGYPVLADEDQGSVAVARFGIEPVLPFSVFADGQGRIVAVKLGELHRAEADAILAAVERVELGHQSLPDARRQIADELHRLAIQRAKQGVQP